MTTPLGDFKVDWNGIRQSFTEPGSGRSATAPSHVSRLFTWTDIDRKGEARRPGAQFRHMFYSKLDVVDHDEWQFERALGKGGYGAAALFRKRDASQNVIDVSSISKAKSSLDSRFLVALTTPYLSRNLLSK